MKRYALTLLAASLLGLAGTASSAEIEVMTQNQYLGANLNPIIEAGSAIPFDPAAFNAAVVGALAQIAGNLPRQRFQALGAVIAERKPHLVGLQEMFKFECEGAGCADGMVAGAFNDHLEGTLEALGNAYVPVAIVENLNITLPIQTGTGGAFVTVLDRDVILARSDIAADVTPVAFPCGYPSADGCNFTFVGAVTLAGQTVRVERGFVGVDATVGGKAYRFINTHLEVRDPEAGNPYSRAVQSAQANQLMVTAIGTLPFGRELIIVGDINSDPRDEVLQGPLPPELATPPYMQFVEWGGLTDVWTKRPGATTGKGAPLVGFSCCQDEDLGNLKSALSERIDMIFTLTAPLKVLDARLLGESVGDKTMPKGGGVWPADHASVAARIQF